MGFPDGASVQDLTCQCRRRKETWIQSLDWEDLLEEGIATHSSILAWRIPWTEEPVHRVGKSRTGLKQLSMHVHTQGGLLIANGKLASTSSSNEFLQVSLIFVCLE